MLIHRIRLWIGWLIVLINGLMRVIKRLMPFRFSQPRYVIQIRRCVTRVRSSSLGNTRQRLKTSVYKYGTATNLIDLEDTKQRRKHAELYPLCVFPIRTWCCLEMGWSSWFRCGQGSGSVWDSLHVISDTDKIPVFVFKSRRGLSWEVHLIYYWKRCFLREISVLLVQTSKNQTSFWELLRRPGPMLTQET